MTDGKTTHTRRGRTYDDDDDDDDDNNNNLLCRFDLQFTCWFDGVNNVFFCIHTHAILRVGIEIDNRLIYCTRLHFIPFSNIDNIIPLYYLVQQEQMNK